jgi:putative ABC transport system substrate-binding protein
MLTVSKDQVEVVVVSNTGTAARVQHVTRTLPVVVCAGGDLMAAGLVASLAHPGGNVTGLQLLQPDLAGKRLEFLQGAVPRMSRVGFLFLGPRDSPVPAATLREVETAARALGVELRVLELQGSPDEFPRTFTALTQAQVRAVVVQAHPFMYVIGPGSPPWHSSIGFRRSSRSGRKPRQNFVYTSAE